MPVPSPLIAAVLLLSMFLVECAENAYHAFGMDSKDTCLYNSARMHYIEDGQSALVLGKRLSEQLPVNKVCKLRFKPLSTLGHDYLKLKFDSFYINDCQVTLSISQSSDSTFASDVTEMAHLECAQRSPHILYAKRDHSVQIILARVDIYLRNYNFRINVSLSDGPPKTGPTVAVIIGISAALIAVIAIIAFILIKYIRLKNSVLRERRAERAIESALYLYNSQDLDTQRSGPPPYTTIAGEQTTNGANPSPGANRNGVANGSRSQDENQALLTERLNFGRNNGHARVTGEGDMIPPDYGDSKDCIDAEGELPPSYEEALEMPKPDSPIYANTTP